MDISTTSYKRCELVKVAGRIDSASAPRFEEALQEVLERKRYNIVLDLSGLEYISSAGLRAMVSTQKVCKEHGGQLVLAAVPKAIQEVLDLTGLDALFTAYPDTVSAVGSF